MDAELIEIQQFLQQHPPFDALPNERLPLKSLNKLKLPTFVKTHRLLAINKPSVIYIWFVVGRSKSIDVMVSCTID